MDSDIISQQKALIADMENSPAGASGRSTVVEMQEDYANDDQICLTTVAFVPEDICEIISKEIIGPLREKEPGHYYYSSEQMHLTIKNVRVVHRPPRFNKADIEKVNQLFKKIIPNFTAPEFLIEGVMLWPTSISVLAYGDENLQKLVKALDEGLKKIGIPDDKKYLSDSICFGSVTICRLTKEPSREFVKAVKSMRNLEIGKLRVKKINLVSGNAVLHPKSRNIIAEYKLKQK